MGLEPPVESGQLGRSTGRGLGHLADDADRADRRPSRRGCFALRRKRRLLPVHLHRVELLANAPQVPHQGGLAVGRGDQLGAVRTEGERPGAQRLEGREVGEGTESRGRGQPDLLGRDTQRHQPAIGGEDWRTPASRSGLGDHRPSFPGPNLPEIVPRRDPIVRARDQPTAIGAEIDERYGIARSVTGRQDPLPTTPGQIPDVDPPFLPAAGRSPTAVGTDGDRGHAAVGAAGQRPDPD